MVGRVADVAIVGAGPAGAWTAYRLARAGARVVLFDPSHPREKPCGGGVTGRALAIVSDAIGGRLAPSDTVRVRAARIGDARVPLDDGALVVVGRRSFDGALLEAAIAAGASFEPARVLDVDVGTRGVALRTSAGVRRADAVVAADGANSLVRRRVSRGFRRDQLSIATGFYASGATSHEIVIEFVADPPGYIWSFPRPDHLAVGICAQADAGAGADALRARVAGWIQATGLAPGATLVPYSWPIPSLGAADFSAPVAGPRWLLVGDAAGLVDPITREGIFFGLRSADFAAAALGEAEAHGRYAAQLREEVVAELALAARLKAGFFTPPFVRLLVTALQRSAAIRTVLADLVAGRQGYRTLKWRLLRTLEIGLAWDALIATRSRRARERAGPAE